MRNRSACCSFSVGIKTTQAICNIYYEKRDMLTYVYFMILKIAYLPEKDKNNARKNAVFLIEPSIGFFLLV
jgi:hypothetical protein